MAFKRKILGCKDQLYRLALQMLRNAQDAEDAVSDLYIKVLEKKEQFSQYDNLEGALIRSMRNHCINLLKSRKHFQPIDEVAIEISAHKIEAFGDDERLALVQRIIHELPEKTKTGHTPSHG